MLEGSMLKEGLYSPGIRFAQHEILREKNLFVHDEHSEVVHAGHRFVPNFSHLYFSSISDVSNLFPHATYSSCVGSCVLKPDMEKQYRSTNRNSGGR